MTSTISATELPLPPGFTPAYRDYRPQRPLLPLGGGAAPGDYPPRIPAGPPLSGVLTTVTGPDGQTVHLHRHTYRTTHPDDAAWTAHGYAYRCTRCRTIAGAHDVYASTLRDADAHRCPKGEPR